MLPADAGRLPESLDELSGGLDPPLERWLRGVLGARGMAERVRIRDLPPGVTWITLDCDDGVARPILARERHGTAVAALQWAPSGELSLAWVRIADRRWVAVEPRGWMDAPWGVSDRLWLADAPGDRLDPGGHPLTVFQSLDYRHVDRIPALADPGRLPAGVGTTVLNLLACLAADQRSERLGYRGPFPSEQLFLALLEPFRYHGNVSDPLTAFRTGNLEWAPAPFAPIFDPTGAYLQRRNGVIEKVVWRGVTYYRERWQEVRRYAPRRVTDDGELTVCGLWMLGERVEDHLVVDSSGVVRAVLAPETVERDSLPLPFGVRTGVAELVAATSSPALAPVIRELASEFALEWGTVERDLVAFTVEGRMAGEPRTAARARPATGARISHHVRDAVVRRLRSGAPPAVTALSVLAEIAGLVGDQLRLAGQQRLLTASADEQLRALAAQDQDREVSADPRAAGVITAAVEALLEDLRSAP